MQGAQIRRNEAYLLVRWLGRLARARPGSSLADTSVSSLAELGPSVQAARLFAKSSSKHLIKQKGLAKKWLWGVTFSKKVLSFYCEN
jgi:hypothetical protein